MSSPNATDDANGRGGERWLAAMLDGNFEAAWRESDALRQRDAPDPHRFWDGLRLEGKRVIVRCLHGLGDAVQMMQYARLLAETADSVVWEVPPQLVELARCFHGVDEVVTWGDDAPAVAPVWNSQIEVMELPYVFRTAIADLPVARRYCELPSREVRRIRTYRGSGRRVGLVWSCGSWNRDRAVPFEALEPLLRLGEFWNLQGGEERGEGTGLQDAEEIWGEGLVGLAAAIGEMDLVITVDTLAAHLAGALGVPVWVMLQKDADWRWQARGETCAWYPSMRLFRQTRQGDWAAVVEQMCAEMQ